MKILVRSTCGKEFADDVFKLLLPNRLAIVAEVAEEWTTPVDIHMERIGGIVFRSSRVAAGAGMSPAYC